MGIKKLADIEWLHLGKTNEYKDLKKFIADICYDVTKASCINEICINDICAGFRLRGYEVVSKDELDRCISESDAESLKAELTAAKELIDAHYYIMGEVAAQITGLRSQLAEAKMVLKEIASYKEYKEDGTPMPVWGAIAVARICIAKIDGGE